MKTKWIFPAAAVLLLCLAFCPAPEPKQVFGAESVIITNENQEGENSREEENQNPPESMMVPAAESGSRTSASGISRKTYEEGLPQMTAGAAGTVSMEDPGLPGGGSEVEPAILPEPGTGGDRMETPRTFVIGLLLPGVAIIVAVILLWMLLRKKRGWG